MLKPVDYCEANTEWSHCYWRPVFTDNMRKTLKEANNFSGWVTLIVGLVINSTILMSNKLRNEKAYRTFLHYTMAVTVRRGVPTLLMALPSRCIAECICWNRNTCTFIAVLDTYMSVFEIEAFTHVCIERFICAFYKYKGWYNPEWHTRLFLSITMWLAGVYTVLPLLGYGSYGKDMSCDYCTISTLLPTEYPYKLIVVLIFALMYIKPMVVMAVTLIIARRMEKHYSVLHKKTNTDSNFTRALCKLYITNMILAGPDFCVRSVSVVSQIISGKYGPKPRCYALWAMAHQWISPAVALIVFVWYNERVRAKMLNLINSRPIDSDEPTSTDATPALEPVQKTKI